MNLFREAQWKVLKRRIQKLRFLFPQRETFSFTLELEPECEYEVFIDGESAGKMRTNLSGNSVSAWNFRRTGSDNESCKMLIY